MNTRALAFLGFVTLLGLTGCGKDTKAGDAKTATVTGKVTLPGDKPLTGGQISFYLASDPSKLSTTTIRGDGTYEALGVPQGECRVAIDTSTVKNLAMTGTSNMPGMSTNAGVKYVPINYKFTRPETSGLTTTVAGSTSKYDPEVK